MNNRQVVGEVNVLIGIQIEVLIEIDLMIVKREEIEEAVMDIEDLKIMIAMTAIMATTTTSNKRIVKDLN